MTGRGRIALIAVLLGGCATLPGRPVAPQPEARAGITALEDWRAEGRVAVRAGAEGFSARFDWRERVGRGELGVRGPFGAGSVRITRLPERITIESGSQAPVEVPAPFDTLDPALADRLGFPLPLEPLRYWVLGVPSPQLPVVGDAGDFEQGGWRVTVSDFVAVAGAPAPLPAKLVLTRDTTRIRVIIDRWQVPGP